MQKVACQPLYGTFKCKHTVVQNHNSYGNIRETPSLCRSPLIVLESCLHNYINLSFIWSSLL